MSRILSRLDKRWLRAASRQLCANLNRIIETEIAQDVEHILAWVSFFPGEVDLTSFIDRQLDHRKIYLPRALPDRSMTFLSIGKDWLSSMQSGQFGIPEPGTDSGQAYNLDWARETVVITPGLAFDKEGGRLGRGGGYYDRFFARGRMVEATKVGVCWTLQIGDLVPVESHDVTMDWICHERGWLRTGVRFEDDFDEE
jgi:5-formyltetrahydrofolate cyclo-ligase